VICYAMERSICHCVCFVHVKRVIYIPKGDVQIETFISSVAVSTFMDSTSKYVMPVCIPFLLNFSL
jgi:hypothetical protein